MPIHAASNMISSLLLQAAGALAVYLVYRALRLFLRRSPLLDVPGPESPSFLFGHQSELRQDHDEALTEQWLDEYGHVVSHKGMFGVRVMVADCTGDTKRDVSLARSSRTISARSNTYSPIPTRFASPLSSLI
jgi:hypothetical protein